MAKLSSTHIFGNLVVDGNIISDGNIDGNADTASKVNNSIKIQLNGGATENTNQFTFDGSAAKNINITPSSIGAATTSTATTSANGLMSSTDKSKLDRIATNANNYSHPTTSGNKHIPSGGSSGQILRWSADGTAVWGNDNNTTYSTGTTSALGLTKLYTGTGTATDGTMTQAALKTALDGKAASSHGNHVPTTQTANNAVFLRNDNTWQTVTPANIGAAASSHTHNYAGSSSAGGAANSAVKATQDSAGQQINTTYIKGLSVSGKTITYTKGDGTTGTITTQDTNTTYSVGTASALGLTKLYTGTGTATDGTMTQAALKTALDGKANSSHTHNSLMATDLSGLTVSLNNYNLSSGTPKVAYYFCPTDGNGSNITGRPNDNDKKAFNLKVESLRYSSTSDYITKQTYTQGSQKIIYVRYCTNGTWSAWEKVYTSTQKPTASEIGASATGHTHNYAGSSSAGGAANSATKLATARTINGTSFDGSANITTANWGTARNIYISDSAGSNTGAAVSVNGSGNATLKLPATIKATLSGNASTATKATQDSAGQQINTTYIKGLSVSGKTITYTKGDGTTGTITTQDTNTTYSANTGIKLNGTTFQHTNSVTAGTAQGDANKTLTFGGTFTIPTVTYDAQGHITSKGTTTMTMPATPTSVSGNAGSASKVNNSIKVQLNGGTTEGTNQFTFNGSAAKNINITPSSIGATTTEYVNEHVQAASKVVFSDNQTLQQKLDSGALNGKNASFLVVTEAEYNAITNKDPNIVYLIKEEY